LRLIVSLIRYVGDAELIPTLLMTSDDL